MARRKHDQYFTPEFATQILLAYRPDISGVILEPCVGNGDMAGPLRERGRVWTNDIDERMPADVHMDATGQAFWNLVEFGPLQDRPNFIVSNPPFNVCASIVQQAYDHASVGIAMLLRLSFLEPCGDRADFLAEHPPDDVLVLPRISFTGNGKTDNCTCAWFVWTKSIQAEQDFRTRLRVIGKTEAAQYISVASM